jgi:hypothetical protein
MLRVAPCRVVRHIDSNFFCVHIWHTCSQKLRRLSLHICIHFCKKRRRIQVKAANVRVPAQFVPQQEPTRKFFTWIVHVCCSVLTKRWRGELGTEQIRSIYTLCTVRRKRKAWHKTRSTPPPPPTPGIRKQVSQGISTKICIESQVRF